MASLGLAVQLELGPEIVNLVEEIERKGQAWQVQSKIALEAFGLGDTDNAALMLSNRSSSPAA